MNDNDLVSVIVPVYNTKKELLDKCINSIINQTYSNIEVIIVDDGSEKEIAKVCDSYKEVDNRINVFHKINEGVSIARNYAIDNSKGKWILFVDSDDTIFSDAVEHMIENSLNMDIVLGKTKLSYEKESRGYKNITHIDDSNKELLFKSLFLSDESFCNAIGICSKLINKDFIIINSIKFNKELHYGEDLLFNLEMFINTNSIVYVPYDIYEYYIGNPNSATFKYNPKLNEEQLKLIELLNYSFQSIVSKYHDYYLDFLYYLLKKELDFQIFHKFNKNSYINKVKLLKKSVNNVYYEELINDYPYKKLGILGKSLFFILKHKLFYFIFIYNLIKKHYSFIMKVKHRLFKEA